MRYAQIRSMDVSNGEGIGISLFVQGCDRHCKNCFNEETWDFNAGIPWTQEIEDKFVELAQRPHIKRVTILGGEPLADQNFKDVHNLIIRLKKECNDKKIWLYTGYTVDMDATDDYWWFIFDGKESPERNSIIKLLDVLVEGPFIESKKDLSLAFRGSSNQRVVDVQKSIGTGDIVLYME